MSRETEREEGRGKGEEAPPALTRVARGLRRIIGAPDYQAYLERCRTAEHPVRLTEQQYVQEFFEAKGKGVRCC